ncbi:hypothetical protein QBC46DRAFT_317501 [Diplogelasinospora grovesii]|uniref:Peptidase A1 domain-containing protein n=1 Tax=Diplogelasinospora grovesii TaxID=303347 RepID=A0AAN6N4B5_9PEZI|nr:hypothetical protein QBC46DRAFT_317501 [Diplogelasinospora grovesii]
MKVILFSGLVCPAIAGLLRGTAQPDRVAFRDALTTNYVSMRRSAPASNALSRGIPSTLAAWRAGSGNVTTNLQNVHDIYYIIDLKVGNQTIPVSVDTGSSDTWMVQQPYECASMFWSSPNSKPNCGLGDGFKGNLSGGIIDGSVFSRSYTDGTFVRGYFGYEDVTIGGLTAKHQQLAIVNYTYWYGDGLTSGLLGLAYPLMTSLNGESPQSQKAYDPVFTTMWKSKLVLPLFSIALSRDEEENKKNGTAVAPPKTGSTNETSFLALGGLPPVDYDDGSWARTPIQSMQLLKEWGLDNTTERGLYVIVADSYVYGRTNSTSSVPLADQLTKNTTQFPVMVDAGSTLTILPTDLVQKLYKSFDPPAQYLSGTGLYYAPCNATIPKFGVQIGDSTFYIAPEDLLKQAAHDETGYWCRVGVTDSDSGPHVLGVTFLTNVVAVFDIGATEMRFAARRTY